MPIDESCPKLLSTSLGTILETGGSHTTHHEPYDSRTRVEIQAGSVGGSVHIHMKQPRLHLRQLAAT